MALVGRVGAGCSTLLAVAAGLAPRVTGGRLTGTVEWDGGVRVLLLPEHWAQLSGMGATVADEVAFGPANLGWPLAQVRASAKRAMTRVGAAALADRNPLTLSGGELQRVMLAGVLAMEPSLLLLDEPSAGLAPVIVQQLFELVKAIRAGGLTVLIVEQNVQQVLRVVDRAYLLKAGSIRAAGAARELLESETIREAYLGV